MKSAKKLLARMPVVLDFLGRSRIRAFQKEGWPSGKRHTRALADLNVISPYPCPASGG